MRKPFPKGENATKAMPSSSSTGKSSSCQHMTQDGDNVILRKSDEVVVFFGCVLHKVKRVTDLCTTPEKAKKKRG